jgi:hypothetical protein
MIKNGLYALNASSRDGVAEDVGGVLILHDGQLHGGDAYVFYTGRYECFGAGAKVDAMALLGEQSIRYDATLRLLVAG